MTEQSARTGSGLALKERDESHIRAALEGREEWIVEVALKAHQYAVKNGIGVTAMAHQTHIPNGTLSQFFSGTYNGVEANIAERLQDFFRRMAQKEMYGEKRSFVETKIARAMWNLADKIRVVRRIQWLRSPEQCGKSTSLQRYTVDNNSGRTIMIEIPGAGGFGDFLWALAAKMNIAYSCKLAEKRLRIREGLSACDLLILDEAHNIWTWTDRDITRFLDYLRTDLFANGARGILLVETNSDSLQRLSVFRKRARYNVGQLIGRMRNNVVVIDPADDISPDDVAALVGRYYKPGKAMLAKLHSLATQEGMGHFGLVLDIVNEAWSRAKAAKKDLTDTQVEEVARETMADLKSRESLYTNR